MSKDLDIFNQLSQFNHLTEAPSAETKEELANKIVGLTDGYQQVLVHQNDLHQEKVKNLKQDRNQRRYFGWALFVLVVFWSIAIFILIFFKAFGKGKIELSDDVLKVLLETSLFQIVGLMYVVANYLFPKSDNNNKPQP